MSMRLMSPVPARVIQTLQDYLPDELNLIDTEEGASPATPDVPNGSYFTYPRALVTDFPAIRLRLGSSRIVDVRPDTFGQRVVAEHRVDVLVDVQLQDADGSALVLQQLVHRYMAGIFRVLCVYKEGLQTIADPTRWAELTLSAGDLNPGPEPAQAAGEMVRTGTVPIVVRRTEVRA
jgi:hypothetical protein